MRALHRKLLRDLWQHKGQAAAIAAVVACGVAMWVMYLSNFDSLRLTRDAYYERQRFADVFASVRRAPARLAARLAEIPGVSVVETRVVADVTIDLPDLVEPAVGRIVGLPEGREPAVNAVFLRRGRYPEPGRADEVLAGEAFVDAHGLIPGDRVGALVNGRRRWLTIVGVALSPEYVYTIRAGDVVPDDRLFGLFWMGEKALAAAFDLEGAFNDVALALGPGASEPEVIARVDDLLAPWGGLGAVPRSLQTSAWYLENELAQLQGGGFIVPMIFLLVAAFLLNVALGRLVAVQREQIAALKALGYADRAIGLHYVGWGLAVAVAGALLGIVAGIYLGQGMTSIYQRFFRFPELVYHLRPEVVAGGVAVSLAAAVAGALGAVRRAMTLPPAEAMRPEPPALYRRSLVERLGLARWLSPPGRMVVRNLERRPGRTLVSVGGIALAAAVLIVGMFFFDAIDAVMGRIFYDALRQDLTVTFVEPSSSRAFHEVERLPGVLAAERQRTVPVRLHVGPRSRRVALVGLPEVPDLQRVVDLEGRLVPVPPEGLLLSAKLAEVLGVAPGGVVRVEVLEGARPVRELPVAALVEDVMGLSAYVGLENLHRLLREGRTVTAVAVAADEGEIDRLYRRLKALPAVAAVGLKAAALDNFRRTLSQNLGLMITFNVAFAAIIAFGVVYNAARISLSERSRELASLRVLGFTRGEISTILLGELAALTLVAIPVGFVLGYVLAGLVVTSFNTEIYRFPLVVWPRTFAYAGLVVAAAAVVSGLAVRRKLDHLDLVAVLKTKE